MLEQLTLTVKEDTKARHRAAMKLHRQYVEKPWGRTELPAIFEPALGRRIGEVWFVAPWHVPLMAKYLFTSEKLSVQVHPNDEQAIRRGFTSGKSECWYILDAESDSTIGLGLRNELSEDQLRHAAMDGSIVDAIDWKPVKPGDFFYVPPGTIHAIGSGISLMEFQQNSDVTYRLYDYGRPRELHLDDGVVVANRSNYSAESCRNVANGEDAILVQSESFTLMHTCSDAMNDRRRWVLPLEGVVSCGDVTASAGECLVVQAGERIDVQDARMLIGAAV